MYIVFNKKCSLSPQVALKCAYNVMLALNFLWKSVVVIKNAGWKNKHTWQYQIAIFAPRRVIYLFLSVTEYLISMTEYSRSVTEYLRSVTEYLRSVTEYLRSVTEYHLSVTQYLISVTEYLIIISDGVPKISHVKCILFIKQPFPNELIQTT